ncbi:MAG: tRNA pseudouridine(55) synthase TruB, partial [Saprospiraceae bacterium]|nr:tRNA pseudouridine(55) synthase TruB [Saprospiraceae bacterium]
MELIRTEEDLQKADFARGAMLLVDKPADWTSFDVVNKVRGSLRRMLQVRKIKVGHSGTLDPAATGLLVLCTGKWTRQLHDLQGLDKRYDAVIELGAVTPSMDGETEVTERKPFEQITRTDIEHVLRLFTGDIAQVPPMYSAIKVKGTPLYKLARRGEELELKARQVTVHEVALHEVTLPEVSLSVHCSKGTYI